MKSPLLTILLAFFLMISISSCVSAPESPVIIETPKFLYDSLILEIQPSTKNAPTQKQLEKLREVLDQYSIAPKECVHFILREKLELVRVGWFLHQLNSFEKKHRLLNDKNLEDRHLILWMGFIPGRLMDLQYVNTIGLKYGPTSTVLMEHTSDDLKRVAVMFHEILHTQGLVNLSHRDEEPCNEKRPSHCNDESCTMFWIVPNRPRLCKKCQLDLHRTQ